MGQGTSRPAPSSTQHVFVSDTPVRFSPDLVDALQASPETDSTRSKDLELHIQSRVTAELTRLEAEATRLLQETFDKLSSDTDSPSSSLGNDGTVQQDKLANLSRDSVQKEIDELKKRLQARKIKEDIAGDKDVKKAKEEVTMCLRVKDRRPLDCWTEVEAFKREVGRLEKAFLGRVLE